MSYTNLLPLACQHPAHWITLTGAISPRGTGVPSPGEFHLANPAKWQPSGFPASGSIRPERAGAFRTYALLFLREAFTWDPCKAEEP